MDYKKKVEYAERVAKELQNQKSSEELKSMLKAEGLFESDIAAVFLSAQNIIGDEYSTKINTYLIEDKAIHESEELSHLDSEMLDRIISTETNKIAIAERKKITQLIKEGQSEQEVLDQVDTRFLPTDQAIEQINGVSQVNKQNSSSGRMLNIGGGVGLIALTGLLILGTGRIFYFLPIIGIGMIIKGFMTEKMAYED